MADLPANRTRGRTATVGLRSLSGELVRAFEVTEHERDILVASAQLLEGTPRESYVTRYKSWQDELWELSRSVGEYGSVMDWFASGVSRMHLVAAIQRSDDLLREPEPVTEGPAAELVNDLVLNARGGETQYLMKWGRHLGIPGVGFFLGEDRPGGVRVYDVKSAKQIRRSTKPVKDRRGKIIKNSYGEPITGFDVLEEYDRWRPLEPSSLVGRIFRPDDEYDFNVSSWSRHALTTLREIDLYNRHIVATLLSRLVFNGILLIPDEVTFPVNPQFKDAPDPFIAELIAVASRGIKDPGSPASAIPLPLRVKSEFIDKFTHLIIATGVDEKVIQGRAAAVSRLVRQLPAPPEASEGKSELNHWNAWADSADNVKFYFGSTMEILTGGLTELFLWPMLAAAGQSVYTPDGKGRYVVWYDASDLVSQPDNSENAQAARGLNAISNEAYLKITGLDEADTPTDDELKKQILTGLASAGLPIPDAFYKLFPDEKPPEQAVEQAEAMAKAQLAGQPQRLEQPKPNPDQVAGAANGSAGPSPNGAPATGPKQPNKPASAARGG